MRDALQGRVNTVGRSELHDQETDRERHATTMCNAMTLAPPRMM
jgi:hypothetical protein